MSKFSIDEVEAAFRCYYQTGIVCEDWEAWTDLFTEDVHYEERVYGTMQGRETVRAWMCPLAEKYREIYGVYDFHQVDPSGRVVFRILNRRDLPGPDGSIAGYVDFPGVSIVQYAGGGKWSAQEDYWAESLGREAYQRYEEARRVHDPNHRTRGTRAHWGDGPEWTKGAASFEARLTAPAWPAQFTARQT